MSPLTVIIIGVIIFGAAAVILIPGAKSLLKGFLSLFVQDMASTPEGAKAIYTEKINDLQDNYRRASDSYRMVSGEYEKSKEELERLQKRLQTVESQCESFMRNGNEEHALIKAQERQEIIEDIARVGDMMEKYKAAVEEAKEISSMCEQQLQATKKEMRDTIQSMQDNKRLTEVYQSMDKLRTSTGTDKMISAIKEKNENLSKMAAGSKAVYRNSMAAKSAAVEKDARRMESNAYLESLRNKYNKPALENKGITPTISAYTRKVKEPDYEKR